MKVLKIYKIYCSLINRIQPPSRRPIPPPSDDTPPPPPRPGFKVCYLIRIGYWPSVQSRWLDIGQVLFCVFMDWDEVEVHKLAKKERGQYPAILTEQTWSIKDLLCGFWWNFACGIQQVVPSGQDCSILPTRVANHSARFGSSCPLTELAI